MARFRILIDVTDIDKSDVSKQVWIFFSPNKTKKVFELKKLIMERLNLSNKKFNLIFNSEILLDHEDIGNIQKGDIIKLQYEKDLYFEKLNIKNSNIKPNYEDLSFRNNNNKTDEPLSKRRKLLHGNNKIITLHEENNFVQPPIIHSEPSTSSGIHLAHKSNNHKGLEADFKQKQIYDNLIELNNIDLVSNKEHFVCPICYAVVAPEEGVVLKDCLHNFCKECLKRVIEQSDTIQVQCPFRIEEYSCESLLQELEVKSLVTREVFDRYLQQSITFAESQASNSFHCKTSDCSGWCIIEADVSIFLCPVCKRENCLSCAAIHEGQDCIDYQCDMLSSRTNELDKKITEQFEVSGDYDSTGDDDSMDSYYSMTLMQSFRDHIHNEPATVINQLYGNIDKGTMKITVIKPKICEYIDLTDDYGPTSSISADHQNLPNMSLKKKTYEALIELNDLSLVPNKELFECPVCFTDVLPEEGAVLKDCLHSFCKECLRGAIQHSFSVEVQCPFQNESYACDSHLQEQEIRSLVTPEVYDSYLQRGIKYAESQASDSFHCKTPDCPGWCLIEGDVNNFLCSVCNKNNCLTCAAIHEGKNCQQYQDYIVCSEGNEEAKKTWGKLQNMVKRGTAMHCPKCQVIVMKIEGCDYLTCSMCHTAICWRTKGPRWGPGGVGDTSGGCKCMLNGVKCHPKCSNCH